MPLDAASNSLDRRLFGWTLLACAAIWAAMAVPMFRGQVYVADDLGAYHLPLRSFYSEQLGRGQSFDWLPSLYNGFYLTGEGQVGSYHPLHLVLYRCLPLPMAFDLELLLSYPLMLAGTYAFLMRRLGQRWAALFGGLVFTFSGFNLLHFLHPNAVAVVAHIPWLLWAIDMLLTTPNLRRRGWAVAAIALLTGSQILLGYPQYVWFSLLIETGYVISRFQSIAGRPWAAISLWLAALLLGLLVGGVQLLPTIGALGQLGPQFGRFHVYEFRFARAAQSVAIRRAVPAGHARRGSEHARAWALHRGGAAVAVLLARAESAGLADVAAADPIGSSSRCIRIRPRAGRIWFSVPTTAAAAPGRRVSLSLPRHCADSLGPGRPSRHRSAATQPNSAAGG